MKPGSHKRRHRACEDRVIGLAALAWIVAISLPIYAHGSIVPRTVMLSIARDGDVLLAVGEHGTVVRSIDSGVHWAIVPVPTQATLTRVIVSPYGIAYAVGFDATVLRSADAGLHWSLMLHDDTADNPLFGIATAGQGALAVGGFGRAYASADGITWHRAHVIPDDNDFHLNAVLRPAPRQWLVVGEQALVLVSQDDGAHWRRQAMPLQGSLFGAVVVSAARWVVYGLRGHVATTSDAGVHWNVVDSGVTTELLGGTLLSDGRLLLAGNRGTGVILDKNLLVARPLDFATRESFADCVQAANGVVWAVGDAGLSPLNVPGP